jgi:group I intron endonuclease
MNYKNTNISTKGHPLDKRFGIYWIRNTINDKVYIGSAKNLTDRKKHHFLSLEKGTHHCVHLQRSYNKYGEENFIFELIMYVDDFSMLLKVEQIFLDMFFENFFEYIYNTYRIAGSGAGHIASEETRKKISESGKGKIVSEETKRKISESQLGEKNWNYGNKASEETRKKMSESRMGDKNPNYGKTTSDETKKQISLANSGENSALYGKPKSEETKRKMSLSNAGKSAGTKSPNAKLTEDDVVEIKKMIGQGMRNRDIVKLFTVSDAIISAIRHGKVWKHVK